MKFTSNYSEKTRQILCSFLGDTLNNNINLNKLNINILNEIALLQIAKTKKCYRSKYIREGIAIAENKNYTLLSKIIEVKEIILNGIIKENDIEKYLEYFMFQKSSGDTLDLILSIGRSTAQS